MSTFTQGEINDIVADFLTIKQQLEHVVRPRYDSQSCLDTRTVEQIAGQIVAAKVANGGYNKQCSTPAKN